MFKYGRDEFDNMFNYRVVGHMVDHRCGECYFKIFDKKKKHRCYHQMRKNPVLISSHTSCDNFRGR